MSINSDRFLAQKLAVLFCEKQFQPTLGTLDKSERAHDGQLEHLLNFTTALLNLVHLLHEVAQVLKHVELLSLQLLVNKIY